MKPQPRKARRTGSGIEENVIITVPLLTPDRRRELLPAAGVPLLYFAFAHGCLAVTFATLAIAPQVAGGFFFHPRMVALVHLVTVGWISGSILGAFYIVGPLVLRMALRPRWADRVAFVAFAFGTMGMSARFWVGDYPGMAIAAALVLGTIVHVAVRAWRGLREARVPGTIKLHVALAFANMLAAGLFGMLIAFNRVAGFLRWSPEHSAYAHAHLAGVGWATMMAVGLAYRLVPMVLPAAMPAGRWLGASALLLQAGVVVLAASLVAGASTWAGLAGASLIAAGFGSFLAHVAAMLRRRLPPPAALPQPDWATLQTRVGFLCLLAAVACGLALFALQLSIEWHARVAWAYGVFGLVGFLSQLVVGIQGRLLPMHAWYREFERRGSQPPPLSAHELVHPGLSRAVFVTWLLGVPLLAGGLAFSGAPVIRAAGVLLLIGVALNAAHGWVIATRTSRR
jgi:hypothetical protein